MNMNFIAEPIVDINEKVIGVELLTRFSNTNAETLDASYVISEFNLLTKRTFLYKQLEVLHNKKEWFIDNSLFCTINIDYDMSKLIIKDDALKFKFKSLPFLKLEISEKFHKNEAVIVNNILTNLTKNNFNLWLDDLGAGNANVNSLINGYFDVVKIDRCFYNQEILKDSFPILIKNIKKYCNKIVIEGVEDRTKFDIFRTLDIWGLQGYLFKSVSFEDIYSLCVN